jgi:hypothetical protein
MNQAEWEQHLGEPLVSEEGAALLTVAAAIIEKTAPAQRVLKCWLSLARNRGLPADVPMRCRRAQAWGCTDAEVREIAAALHAAVDWQQAMTAAGFTFKMLTPGPSNRPAA